MGRGKIDDVILRAVELDAETLVFDRNLTPAQASAIAKVTDLKIGRSHADHPRHLRAARRRAGRQAAGRARAAEIQLAAPCAEG